MLVIPFEVRGSTHRGPLVVVLVLEKENLDRMMHADPVDLKFSDYRKVMSSMPLDRPLDQLDLVICYEADIAKLLQFKVQHDIEGLINWLERGRKILPGDVTPPVKL